MNRLFTRYPFYGIQYHPEKTLYEWGNTCNIVHTKSATAAAQHYGTFFVNECRKNDNHFASTDEENRMMIYNYPQTFTYHVAKTYDNAEYQTYLFKPDVDYLKGIDHFASENIISIPGNLIPGKLISGKLISRNKNRRNYSRILEMNMLFNF